MRYIQLKQKIYEDSFKKEYSNIITKLEKIKFYDNDDKR